MEYKELDYRESIKEYLDTNGIKINNEEIEEINLAINDRRWDYQSEVNDEQAAIDLINEDFYDIMNEMLDD